MSSWQNRDGSLKDFLLDGDSLAGEIEDVCSPGEAKDSAAALRAAQHEKAMKLSEQNVKSIEDAYESSGPNGEKKKENKKNRKSAIRRVNESDDEVSTVTSESERKRKDEPPAELKAYHGTERRRSSASSQPDSRYRIMRLSSLSIYIYHAA
jgi:hypothetical protein